MGLRVEGVTEASLTSGVFVACLFQHSCRGLAGLRPSAFSEGDRKLRVARGKGGGGGGGGGRGGRGGEEGGGG